MFQSQDDTDRATRLSKLTTNQERHWGGDNSNETKIRQSNSDDRRAFRAAITNHRSIDDDKSLAISKAHEYFRIAVEDWLLGRSEYKTRAAALEEALTKYLQIAVIDLDLDEKPHIIFETLNARGEPLTQSDLIKNTVMYEADVIDNAQKARELWGMFDEGQWWREEADERLKRRHIDRFLYHWMIMRTRREVPVDRVASRFRSYIERIGKPIEFVAEDIRRAAGIYQNIENIHIPEIKIFLKRMQVMQVGVVTPLLLWLFTSDEVSQEQRLRSIAALESCLMRMMLCGYGSNNLNSVVVSTLNFLENPSRLETMLKERFFYPNPKVNPNFMNPSDIIIMSFVLFQQWAHDRELYEHLITQPMRGSDARKRLVLEAIDMYLRGDNAEPLLDTSKLTLEHVMPKEWQQNWTLPPDTDEIEARNDRDKAIKFIGNLTLVTGKLNRKLKNNPWDEKRKTLDTHSSLFLNKQLLKDAPAVWDEAAIEARSSELAKIIMKIFPSAETFLTP